MDGFGIPYDVAAKTPARLLLPALTLLCVFGRAEAGQAVFLDFDSETTAGEWIYSGGERGAIEGAFTDMYAPFGVTFSATMPVSGDFSTIFFNSDAIGTSTGVDWRNVAFIDDAFVNAELGLDLVFAPVVSENIVKASINLGAHELNHLLGARHHDAFGPVGAGVSTPGNTTKFDPVYPGPAGAGFTGSDFNSLTTVLGFSADKLLSAGNFIGQRTALKILFPAHGVRGTEDGGSMFDTPEEISVSSYPIPNTLPVPPEDPLSLLVFDAVVGAMKGEISSGEADYYVFSGEAGRVVTIEVMSESIKHRVVEGDLTVALLDALTGATIPYFGDFALNADGFEGTDPLLLDLTLPYTGDYVIEIFGDMPGTAAEYELLYYSIGATSVPLPPAAWLFGTAVSLLALRQRRKP